MMMDSPPKLSGETLIVHHIPLVHCQVPDRQCKRSNPFGQPDPGPLRTAPLPEQDFPQADSLARLHRVPSDPAEPVPALETPPEEGRGWDSGASRRQNPFLLSEDEEPLEDDGPLGQRSFRLHSHGQPAFHLHSELSLPPFRLHNTGHGAKPWGAAAAAGQRSDNTVDGQEEGGRKRRPESMELDEYSCHRERDPSDSSSEQDWAADPDGDLGPGPEAPRSRTCSCSSGSEIQRCRCCSLSSQSEPLDHQMGYASDSSCNSSDGVLVNFSALYHKMNGHPPNLNSCEEESSSGGSRSDTSGGGAFYLDLHSSPQEAKLRCCPEPLGTACPCHGPSSPVLDANCNSYDPCGSGGSSSDLTACFQSQARLVVATQNYYKLVTCDLSSQSSPSPAGSSITSCSEEQARVSSPPLQPTEYYLFQRPAESGAEEPRGLEAGDAAEPNANTVEGQLYVNVSPPTLATGRQRSRSYDRNLDRSPSAAGRLGSLERMMSCPVKLSEGPHSLALQSSPPKRVTSFAELAKGRKKNGSGGSSSSSGNNNSSSCSPPFRASRDSSLEFSPIPERRRGGSGGGGGGSVFLEDRAPRHSQSLPPMPWIHSLQRSPEEGDEEGGEGHGSRPQETPPCGQPFFPALAEAGGLGQKDVRARADGGAADGKVFRYSKDQRPTTLPIQPFVFQHHFPRPAKARALQSHLAASLSQLYSRSASAGRCATAAGPQPPSAPPTSAADRPMPQRSADGAPCPKKPPPAAPVAPETTRPSPLGSYSPIRSHGGPFFQSNAADSSSSLSSLSSSFSPPTPDGHPPRSRSCPASANLLPVTSVAGPSPAAVGHGAKEEGTAPVCQKDGPPEFELGEVSSLPPLLLAGGLGLARAGGTHPEAQWKAGCGEALVGVGTVGTVLSRPLNAHHLSPQALKWREYRRRNPLGLDYGGGGSTSGSGLDRKQVPPEPEGRLSRRNPLFELPGALGGGRPYARLNGHSVKQLQLNYSDFFPDYFSLAEKPPAEFCLSPDGNTESISIDLLQKKGLVKAVNMAVDLIVAHFGTSRDPGVKAKLGNSSVSPNVGHLILKYLCPAIREVLSDGLKAYVLDVIIGQRRNVPWSVVEASTQLGPSTKVLHGLYSKVSQYPELTSHTMRFNAFIFGLLNIRSLEFWFNHLYNHEDVLQAHYQPVGFLALSQGVCQGLFEELLLLLQPLSLLPFDLDLLFEHNRLQMGQEQRQKKELLRIRQDLLLSAHSTLQLMRTPGQSGAPEEEEDQEKEDPQQRRSSSSSSALGWGPKKTPKMPEEEEEAAPVQRVKGVGAPSGGKSEEEVGRRQWPEGPPGTKRDKQASWWFQLMQSSQVYIEGPSEGGRAIRYERKAKKPGPTTKKVPPPPPREGVVEGAEACPIAAEVPLKDRPSLGPTIRAPQKLDLSEKEEKGPLRRPSWMGSPPESVLTELKHSKAKEDEEPQKTRSPPKESNPGAPLSNQPKWGCLFGSRKAPKDPKQPPNRLPSGWLSLDRSIFQLVAQTVGAASGAWREAHSDPERLAPDLPPLRPKHRTPLPLLPPPLNKSKTQEGPCQVKALCHHIATEAGQLSFQKGDLLRVLGKADADWLRCGRGAESGLVPVMYVTHAEDQDY